MKKKTDKYSKVIEEVFFSLYKERAEAIKFTRKDIEKVAIKLDIKNLGDILYSFRMRKDLPERIKKCAPKGKEWVIRLAGRGIYTFALTDTAVIIPSKILSVTKIPDATPGIIEKYALSDEQALLAKLRYNRLIDIFTGVTCYSLQSHLRTAISSIGQIETDEKPLI